jgi:hypothetical protein
VQLAFLLDCGDFRIHLLLGVLLDVHLKNIQIISSHYMAILIREGIWVGVK